MHGERPFGSLRSVDRSHRAQFFRLFQRTTIGILGRILGKRRYSDRWEFGESQALYSLGGKVYRCCCWLVVDDYDLNLFFQSKVRMPRVRMGEQQEIETLINEEFAICQILEERETDMDSKNRDALVTSYCALFRCFLI
jgi:hypothetical protein